MYDVLMPYYNYARAWARRAFTWERAIVWFSWLYLALVVGAAIVLFSILPLATTALQTNSLVFMALYGVILQATQVREAYRTVRRWREEREEHARIMARIDKINADQDALITRLRTYN